MKRLWPIGAFLLLLLPLWGCGALGTAAPAEKAAAVVEVTLPPAPSPSPGAGTAGLPAPTPAMESPAPTPQAASLGFVGDILIMQRQVRNAENADGSYDFSGSFYAMEGLFGSVDLMFANYEGTFAGQEAGYSGPMPTAPPATAEDPNPKTPLQTFNAPDQMACDLAGAGVDVLTTANNHCLDRELAGLYRTIEVIRGAGLLQKGTSLSLEDRFTPCIAEVKGIRVGIVAATDSINSYDAKLTGDSRDYAVSRLFNKQSLLQEEIRLTREAGAEFIVACVHWGNEFEKVQNRSQEEAARFLAEAGADAIVGSHPHVVQPLGWIETERDGETLRVPVAYSLGNFISNMSGKNTEYGMFLRLDLARGEDGRVRCTAMSYLPLGLIKQEREDGRTLHQALPCYEEPGRRYGYMPLSAADLRDTQAAFDYVYGVCGESAGNLIGWDEDYAEQTQGNQE